MQSLTTLEVDALKELMNIAAGRAADAMARLFGMRTYMHITEIKVLSGEELPDFMAEEIGAIGSIVTQSFAGDMDGLALMLLPYEHVRQLVRLLTDGEAELLHLSSSDYSVLAELSNILLSACVGMLSQQLGARVRFQLPYTRVNLNSAQPSAYIAALAGRLDFQVLVLSTQIDLGEHRIHTYILIAILVDAEALYSLLRKMLSEQE